MAAHDSPIRSVLARFARVIHSATELVILQFQLTQQDAALAGSKIKPAFIATACAVGLLLSGFPLLSFGLAGALAYGTNLPVWVAQLIVAVLFLALGIGLLFFAVRAVVHAGQSFEASRREAVENLRWFRRTVDESLHQHNHS